MATRAVRRSPEEVRTLLLDAARALFAGKGYAGTSTREIAEKAGVSEALLFRHFGTKAQLFQRAIMDPFNEFMTGYVDHWEEEPVGTRTAEQLCYEYVDGLYQLLSEHRELAMALVAAHAFEDESVHAGLVGGSPLGGLLDQIAKVAGAEASARGFHFDTEITVRVVCGMVMSMALLDEWFFPPGKRRPSRQRIVDEMAAFMLHGLAHRPD